MIEASNWVWKESRSNAADLSVMLCIADKLNSKNLRAWPAVETIAKCCRKTPRSVRRALARLEAAGELTRDIGQGGGKGTNAYRLPKFERWLKDPRPCPGHDGTASETPMSVTCPSSDSHPSARTPAAPTPDASVSHPGRHCYLTPDASVSQSITDPLKKNKKTITTPQTPSGGGRSKSFRFAPPTLAEAKPYGEEIGLPLGQVETFLDYYASIGWKIAGKAMKDWTAAMRNWLRRYREREASKPYSNPNPGMILRRLNVL